MVTQNAPMSVMIEVPFFRETPEMATAAWVAFVCRLIEAIDDEETVQSALEATGKIDLRFPAIVGEGLRSVTEQVRTMGKEKGER